MDQTTGNNHIVTPKGRNHIRLDKPLYLNQSNSVSSLRKCSLILPVVMTTGLLCSCHRNEPVRQENTGPSTPQQAMSQLRALPSGGPVQLQPLAPAASSALWPAVSDDSLDLLPPPKPSGEVSSGPLIGSHAENTGPPRPRQVIPPALRNLPGPVPMTVTAEHDRRRELVRVAVSRCVHRRLRHTGRVRVMLALDPKGKPVRVTATANGTLSDKTGPCVRKKLLMQTFDRPSPGHVADSFVVVVRRGQVQ